MITSDIKPKTKKELQIGTIAPAYTFDKSGDEPPLASCDQCYAGPRWPEEVAYYEQQLLYEIINHNEANCEKLVCKKCLDWYEEGLI